MTANNTVFAGGSQTFNESGGLIGGATAPTLPGSTAQVAPTTFEYKPVKVEMAKPVVAATAGSQGFAAEKRQVQDNDLVQTHLNEMLSTDSDYMKRAETKGLQTASARGLLNSSMAAGAAQASAIDAALPVAQQDAGTYFSQGRANQDSENRSREFTADAANRASMFNAGEANKVGMFNAGEENRIGMFNAGEENKGGLIKLEYGERAILDEKQNAFDMKKQNDQQAHDLEKQGNELSSQSFTDYMRMRQEIQMSDLPAEAKTAKLQDLYDAWMAGSPAQVALDGGTWNPDGTYTPGTTPDAPPTDAALPPSQTLPGGGVIDANGNFTPPPGSTRNPDGTYTHKSLPRRGGRGYKEWDVTIYDANGNVLKKYTEDNGS